MTNNCLTIMKNAFVKILLSKKKIILGYTTIFIVGITNPVITYPCITLDLESFNASSPRSILIKGMKPSIPHNFTNTSNAMANI